MHTLTSHPEKIIALDAEFAEGRELLELAIVDFSENVVMLQRFRPATLTEWNDVKIHGITPEMVKDCPTFRECVPQVQSIIDKATYIVGFAVAENDIAKMKREGIERLDQKRVLELRDWFWHCHGRDAGLDYSSHINLEKCCMELAVDSAQEGENYHSAIFDTRAALRAFKLLMDRFVKSHDELAKASFDDVYTCFADEFDIAKEEYDKELGRGYASISILPTGMYRFRVSQQPIEKSNVVACISVASRKKALLHFSQLFTGEIHEKSFTFPRLSPKKLEQFKSYTNEFQGEEDKMASKLLRLSQKWRR